MYLQGLSFNEAIYQESPRICFHEMKTQQCIHFVGDIKVAPAPTVYQMESRNSGHEMRVNGGVSWPRSAQTAEYSQD